MRFIWTPVPTPIELHTTQRDDAHRATYCTRAASHVGMCSLTQKCQPNVPISKQSALFCLCCTICCAPTRAHLLDAQPANVMLCDPRAAAVNWRNDGLPAQHGTKHKQARQQLKVLGCKGWIDCLVPNLQPIEPEQLDIQPPATVASSSKCRRQQVQCNVCHGNQAS